MNILLTGATGFIGNKLWRVLLDRGHNVIGLSRYSLDRNENPFQALHVRYELGEELPDSIVDFSPEVLVNLAWNGIPDFSAKTCVGNVVAQTRFLDEMRRLKTLRRILVAGSCKEYGSNMGLCHEEDPVHPDSYFSWAKHTLLDYSQLFCNEQDIELVWFRVFYVYGQGQRSGALVPTLIEALRTGRRPEIKNPNAANDFIYLDDVVDAFVMGIERAEAAGVFNLGSGRLTSVSEVGEIVESLLSGKATYSSMLGIGLDEGRLKSAMVADVSRSKSSLGWEPMTTLSDGIRKAWNL